VATTALRSIEGGLDLLRLTATDLDDLYRAGTVTTIPRGTGAGTAIFAPGRGVGRILAKITSLTAWQGKVIDRDGSHLVNKVSPLASAGDQGEGLLRAPAGSTVRRRSSSTTPRRRWSPGGFTTRFARSRPGCSWDSCTCANGGCPSASSSISPSAENWGGRPDIDPRERDTELPSCSEVDVLRGRKWRQQHVRRVRLVRIAPTAIGAGRVVPR
jgi:hypothetical protein